MQRDVQLQFPILSMLSEREKSLDLVFFQIRTAKTSDSAKCSVKPNVFSKHQIWQAVPKTA